MLKLVPLDILAEITKWTGGFAINALWCTGDRVMQNLMKIGGVTHYIERWEDFSEEPVFPSTILAHLQNLRTLDIHLHPEEQDVPIKNFDIGVLPASLTHLACNSTFIDFSAGSPLASSDAPLVPMSQRFPNLIHFAGRTDDPNVWHSGPKSLTTLKIQCPKFHDSFEFPPNLTELLITLTDISPCPPYPLHLTSLTLDFLLDEVDYPLYRHLPPQLKVLSIGGLIGQTDLPNYLPNNLEVLDIQNTMYLGTVFDVSVLPRSLNTLNLGILNHLPVPTLTPHNVLQLPPRLTAIELPLAGPEELVRDLPSTLTRAIFPDAGIASTSNLSGYIKYLPRGLLHLGLGDAHKLVIDDFLALPPNLTVFTLGSCRDSEGGKAKLLPRTLTKLHLPEFFASEAGELPPGLKWLSLEFAIGASCSGYIPHLPRQNLTHLTVSGLTVTDEDIAAGFTWPPHLVSLNIGVGLFSVTNEAISLLPACLRELHVPGAKPMDSSAFGLLPRKLRTLDITSMSDAKDGDLALLPKTLTSLALWFATSLTHKGMQYLPKLLKIINWNASMKSAVIVDGKPAAPIPEPSSDEVSMSE